jgi:hypothetical protein
MLSMAGSVVAAAILTPIMVILFGSLLVPFEAGGDVRLLEGLCASTLDRLRGWVGSQEAPDGGAGPAPGDDGQEGPLTGDGPDDGGVAPPWLWPLLSLPS